MAALTRSSAALVLLAAMLSACDTIGKDAPEPFEWARPNAAFTYDLLLRGDTTFVYQRGQAIVVIDDTPRALTIVVGADEGGRLRFGGRTAWGGIYKEVRPPILSLYFDVRSDGLHALEFPRCTPPELWDTRSLAFVRVPAKASPGMALPQYACRGRVSHFLRVERVDVMVDSPWGELPAFVLTDEAGTRWREYWNVRHGLLRMELLDSDREPYATYSLVEASL